MCKRNIDGHLRTVGLTDVTSEGDLILARIGIFEYDDVLPNIVVNRKLTEELVNRKLTEELEKTVKVDKRKIWQNCSSGVR